MCFCKSIQIDNLVKGTSIGNCKSTTHVVVQNETEQKRK